MMGKSPRGVVVRQGEVDPQALLHTEMGYWRIMGYGKFNRFVALTGGSDISVGTLSNICRGRGQSRSVAGGIEGVEG